MGRELERLVQSMICGALLVLVYDGIQNLSDNRKTGESLDTAVDILFWSAAGLFFIFYVSERERGKRAVLSALRNFAGSRCLVLGNRAFL